MDNLPKLPHAVAHILLGDDSEDVFTADQMQAYARAAVEAEREACAVIADGFYRHIRQYTTDVPDIGGSIRARGKP